MIVISLEQMGRGCLKLFARFPVTMFSDVSNKTEFAQVGIIALLCELKSELR
jgi:hypothetical protein